MTTADLRFLRVPPCVRFVSDRTRNYPQPTASVALTFDRESIPPSAYVHLVERSPQDRLCVAAVAAGCDQASSRSVPSCISCWRSRSPSGRGLPRDDSSDLAFYYVHGLQCLVPAAPKLAGHQAIRGIDSVVLPTGMRGLVTRL